MILRKSLIHNKLNRIKLENFNRYLSDEKKLDISKYTFDKIRNFSIIAHVDHGKSTLADRLLEITGTIDKNEKSKNKQVLDRLEVERKRGITVKAQTASMFYKNDYLLNLIDTPGHIDFTYEVSRSLKACQGCLLVVDAAQGVQAQTIANFFLAFEAGIKVIPVINKIDLKTANVEATIEQLTQTLDLKKEEMLFISAKNGINCEQVLDEIVNRIPSPIVNYDKPFKSLVFDSVYDLRRGAIIYIACVDGEIKKGDKVKSFFTKKVYEVQEVGLARPDFRPSNKIQAGQVGYMICNIRNIKEALVGDTFHLDKAKIEPFPGFKSPKPMVFSGFFPEDSQNFSLLRKSIEKLCINDSSVSIAEDSSPALGQGYRLGFLGLLHMEVFKERLEKEFSQSVIITAPNVPYKVKFSNQKLVKFHGTNELVIVNPTLWPEVHNFDETLEPVVSGTIVCPNDNFREVNQLCLSRRGVFESRQEISGDRVILKYKLPLNEIILDFFDKLKKETSGYASFDYEDIFYELSDLVKLVICLNDIEIEELTQIVHRQRAGAISRVLVEKLRDEIPQKQFKIAIQAKIGGKILARENIKAMRKDVTAKCYGGDQTRKLKLLREQAEGKKRIRETAKIEISKDVLINILRKEK
ncbi:unnamed protein product [Brachionus calyciflorus]|uniref:Translation factor GUF1 homolog, mitochondrial n=1 Tax=Brachionus calyciflorus TaxID=104777 RepID=A0A813M211_9BILA|nr:unnamed protein product [Brachionus calyciflorus]